VAWATSPERLGYNTDSGRLEYGAAGVVLLCCAPLSTKAERHVTKSVTVKGNTERLHPALSFEENTTHVWDEVRGVSPSQSHRHNLIRTPQKCSL